MPAAKRIFLSPLAYLLVSAFVCLISYVVGNQLGLVGFALGWFATTFCLVVLWLIIGLLGQQVTSTGKPPPAATWIIVAFFIKLPIFVLSAKIVQSMGGVAPTFFLVGLGLVYFWLIGWAVAKS